MVNHNWIETKLIQLERARNSSTWNKQKEDQLSYLLKLYHTGRFNTLSTRLIAQRLKKLAQTKICQ